MIGSLCLDMVPKFPHGSQLARALTRQLYTLYVLSFSLRFIVFISFSIFPGFSYYWPLEGNRADSRKFLVEDPIHKSGS